MPATPHTVLLRIFPFLAWPRPGKKSLSDDVLAGITVALVVIPQSLAYAQLAGVPAYFGLYASLLPSIAVAVMLEASSELGESASGGGVAAPIAGDLIRLWLEGSP